MRINNRTDMNQASNPNSEDHKTNTSTNTETKKVSKVVKKHIDRLLESSIGYKTPFKYQHKENQAKNPREKRRFSNVIHDTYERVRDFLVTFDTLYGLLGKTTKQRISVLFGKTENIAHNDDAEYARPKGVMYFLLWLRNIFHVMFFGESYIETRLARQQEHGTTKGGSSFDIILDSSIPQQYRSATRALRRAPLLLTAEMLANFKLHPNKYTLFVVEDNNPLREVLCNYFGKRGYITIGFDSALAALSWFSKLVPDAIVSDVNMPSMNGVDFAKEVRDMHTDMPIVFVTAMTNIDTVSSLIDGTFFIGKPFIYKDIDLVMHKAFCWRNEIKRQRQARKQAMKKQSILDSSDSDFDPDSGSDAENTTAKESEPLYVTTKDHKAVVKEAPAPSDTTLERLRVENLDRIMCSDDVSNPELVARLVEMHEAHAQKNSPQSKQAKIITQAKQARQDREASKDRIVNMVKESILKEASNISQTPQQAQQQAPQQNKIEDVESEFPVNPI